MANQAIFENAYPDPDDKVDIEASCGDGIHLPFPFCLTLFDEPRCIAKGNRKATPGSIEKIRAPSSGDSDCNGLRRQLAWGTFASRYAN
jgi:hypothetical protein